MAITADGAFDASISYSGGANVYTFDSSLGGAVGDIAVVAVSCHASLGAFGAHAGWNFLGTAKPVADLGDAYGAQVALYWKYKASSDASYVFSSGASPSPDVNALGQLIFLRGASLTALDATNSGDYLDDIDEFESFIPPATLTTASVPDGGALLAFAFSNFSLFNVRQFGNEPLVGTYNSATDMSVLSPTSTGTNSGFSVASGASAISLVVQGGRFDGAAPGKFEQFLVTWVAFVVRRAKKGGLFGINH